MLIGIGALLLLVVGGGIGLWLLETTYYHMVTQSMDQVRGEVFRRGPEAPGYSVYLFACTAGRFTYGDVTFPSDMVNRFLACFIVFILIAVHTVCGRAHVLNRLVISSRLYMGDCLFPPISLFPHTIFNSICHHIPCLS